MQKSLKAKGAQAPKRLFYLDNMRIFLTVLVILHHLAIVFGGEGGFIITAPSQNEVIKLILTVFLALNQSYFMGTFFFISGYFSYRTLKKKGQKDFMKGRMKRLVIPAMVYFFVVTPMLDLFIKTFYLRIPVAEFKYSPRFEAIWFIAALSLFDIALAVVKKDKQSSGKNFTLEGTKRKLLVCAIGVGVIAWVIRIVYPVGSGILGFQPAHFPQYIFAYILGTTVARRDLMDTISQVDIWGCFLRVAALILAFFMGVGLTVIFIKDISPAFGGFNPVSLMYSIWEQTMFLSCSILLIGAFKKYMNRSNNLQRALSGITYMTYLVHSAVIAAVVTALSRLSISRESFVFLVVVISITTAFAGAKLLKRFINL